MAYFPAFIKFDNLDILIVGGGDIASKKLKHILDFTNNVKIIAPVLDIDTQNLIKEHNLQYELRTYQKEDIKNFNIIVVAVDDISLQKQIYQEAKLLPNCLVNSVDSTQYCDFIFPSYIKKDDLTIAISTNGKSPAFTKQLRIYLEKFIPNGIGKFLDEMEKYRQTIPKGRERMNFLTQKAIKYINQWGK